MARSMAAEGHTKGIFSTVVNLQFNIQYEGHSKLSYSPRLMGSTRRGPGFLKDDKGSWGDAIRNDEGDLVRLTHGTSPCSTINLIELDALEQGIRLAARY